MLRTITATICRHPIRSSAEIPHSIHGIDFAIPYCGACTKSREIAVENDAANVEHKQSVEAQDPEGDRSRLRAARKRCNKAHLAYVQDQQQQADRHQTEHETPPHEDLVKSPIELDSILKVSTTPRTKDLAVRFSFGEYYRPEEEYRLQPQFDRTTPFYEPGVHADGSGSGFINTSDPYASDTTSELSEYTSEESSDGEHEESSDGRMEESSDQEMEDVVCDAGGEDEEDENLSDGRLEVSNDHEMADLVCDAGLEEEEEDDTVHTPSEEEQDDGEEGNGSYFGRLTREEILERSRVIQERIDELRNRTSL